MLDYTLLPEQWRGGLQRYFQYGIEPGSGLRSVLENDLAEAVWMIFNGVDREKLGHDLTALVGWLYNEAPSRSYPDSPWGSRQAVKDWLARDWRSARESAREANP